MYVDLVPYPEVTLYWSKNVLYENILVSTNVTRDRFIILSKLIHFCNTGNADPNNNRKDYKIKTLTDALIENYQTVYKPGSKIVIDESMVPLRERVQFKAYIPEKIHKYGCKLYKICTNDSYTLNLEVYCGQENPCPPLTHTETFVTGLIGKYLDQGATLFADSYYTTVMFRDVAAAPQTPQLGGGPGQLWGPKLV